MNVHLFVGAPVLKSRAFGSSLQSIKMYPSRGFRGSVGYFSNTRVVSTRGDTSQSTRNTTAAASVTPTVANTIALDRLWNLISENSFDWMV
jgi:hypothetical protein